MFQSKCLAAHFTETGDGFLWALVSGWLVLDADQTRKHSSRMCIACLPTVRVSATRWQGHGVPCLMSEGRWGPLVSTVRANASWVMVTWGPPSPVDRQTDIYESITFPQRCWQAVITVTVTTVKVRLQLFVLLQWRIQKFVKLQMRYLFIIYLCTQFGVIACVCRGCRTLPCVDPHLMSRIIRDRKVWVPSHLLPQALHG